ncbi:Clp protease N-terminal domain-containing protein [Actinospica sp.]|jgi:hypothetical protein|uniref:Clp protease N-terminal domain-containing protein n=1 Tax=Actinospica sp. TaxID=1872142 RepID=UPI002C4D6DA5|nr:Clp protease N-terminal domain-containing protein [Actinospica sp.]HWG25329.1 Clp protease N-terminal domain-containing protein [Actinospica sp.]
MTSTPNLQDLVKSVREQVPDNDPLGQLTKAAEYSTDLNALGDRLLDHFVFQCRQAGMSWTELSGALGVSKQAAHKRFNTAPNFQRLTVKAQAVMQGSTSEARALGHATSGTEHLLLALFEPSDSVAAVTLANLGVSREAVREQILARDPGQPEGPTAAIQASPHAKTALRGSLDEALALGHNYIGTEHMLLSLYNDPEYTSAKILTELGQNPTALHGALLEELDRVMREKASPQ